MSAIEPLPDDAIFGTKELAEASHIANNDPVNLSDWQIRMLACYSMDDAEQAQKRREAALRAKAAAPAPAAAPTGPGGVTAREWKVLRTLTPILKEYDAQFEFYAGRLNELETAIAAFRVRLDSLEARAATGTKAAVNGVQWHGVHEINRQYPEGALTTHGGNLWLAKTTTTSTPGSSLDWVLIVRRAKTPKHDYD